MTRSFLSSGDVGTQHAIEHGSAGGHLATFLSAIALLFSGFSYYESSLRSAELSVFVPPMIHYARDGDNDVLNIPITITNEGARSGTILMLELTGENLRPGAERKSARFHSAFLGEWPRSDTAELKSFAPISVPGNGTFSETVRFYPMDEPLPFLVDDKGDYRFTLKIVTAESGGGLVPGFMTAKPQPLTFEVTLPFISFQHLTFRHGTQAMFNKDWKPATAIPVSDMDARKSAPPAESAPNPPAPEEPKPTP